MPDVQIIKTPTGEELVVLPRAEYDRLIADREMAEDVAAFDASERRLASGEDEILPAAMVDRLLAGANRVRVWREHRGLSAKELAERADVSAAYLSEIERGRKPGSVEAMKALSGALGLAIDDLV